jgi:hypothetical protein
MPIVVKKTFPYDKFKPSQFQGIVTNDMFDKLMALTKRIKPDVKDVVRQYLIDGKGFGDFAPRTKQSVYIRVRYYLQIGINAGLFEVPKKS